ncbi:MAG: hypothetical protein JW995_10375 [Melioribacteraceae bacterium]|nr:hypothetical protein [Melioribacteraceae bacterium]
MNNIAEKFMELPEDVRSGSIKIFGRWFGKPYDNYHRAVSAKYENNILNISFIEGETLEIHMPSDPEIDGNVLRIKTAETVKWSWYYYGKPKTKENLFYLKYTVKENEVSVNTNSPFSVTSGIITEAAVEIH